MSASVWRKYSVPSPLITFHSLPATTPSTCAFASGRPPKLAKLTVRPLSSVSDDGSVAPPPIGFPNRLIQADDRATSSNVSVGSELISDE